MRSVVVFCLLVALVYGLPADNLGKSTDYDHFVFTQTYPAGMCYIYTAQNKGYDCYYPSNCSSWTIHGLWPTYGTTKGPNFCTNDSFNPDAIQSLLSELTIDWPNLLNTTKFYSFWNHEYTKHGTCTGWQEKEFFTRVLELFKQIQPYGNVLNNAGIYPDNDKIETDKIRAALKDYYGVLPALQCQKVKGVWVIQQVELCLDMDYKPMECPDNTDSCTNDTVLYPKSVYSK